jgi:hypothetical protein
MPGSDAPRRSPPTTTVEALSKNCPADTPTAICLDEFEVRPRWGGDQFLETMTWNDS